MESTEIILAELLEIEVVTMSLKTDLLLKELNKCKVDDEILATVIKKTLRITAQLRLSDDRIEVPSIFFVDFSKANEALRKSIYFSENCKAIFEPPSIIVNASWLLELEAALRSFDLAGSLLDNPYLKGDEKIFTLVELIKTNNRGYLSKLRRLEQLQNMSEEKDIVTQMSMLVLFFISHELGHLVEEKSERPFTIALEADAKLEDEVINSVIKLCRHTDEFAKYGFDLPGFEKATDEKSDVRQKEIAFRQANPKTSRLFENATVFFGDEIVADKTGTKLVLNYIEDVAKKDKSTSELHQFLLVKALFVVAVYSWYKDLHTFSEKIGYRIMDSRTLTLTLMRDREQYIRVASLFGKFHRFSLLRSNLAIKAILKNDKSISSFAGKEQIWYERIYSEKGWSKEVLRKWWNAESLKRYILLGILMDTAMKMAYVGCSTGWILDADEKRGSGQILMMHFEPIHIAVRRLCNIHSWNFV
jgi:hypothetical protein